MDRSRFLLALVFGLAAGILAALGPGMDVLWPIEGARRLLSGVNPYAAPYPELSADPAFTWLYYPLPALVLCMPVAWLPDRAAIGVLTGAAYAVLAWVVWSQPARRWALVSYPVVFCVHHAQPWPLLAAAAYLAPALAPLALSKPNVALPVLLARPRWHWLLVGVSAALCAASIPIGWLSHLGMHQNTTIATTLIGAPLMLAALRWRSSAARLVALLAIVPLRDYDVAPYAVLPTSHRVAVLALVLGWLPFLATPWWNPPAWTAAVYGIPALLALRHLPRRQQH